MEKAVAGPGATVFQTKPDREQEEQAQKETELYEQIGRLRMELEWLKKKVSDAD